MTFWCHFGAFGGPGAICDAFWWRFGNMMSKKCLKTHKKSVKSDFRLQFGTHFVLVLDTFTCFFACIFGVNFCMVSGVDLGRILGDFGMHFGVHF